MLPTLQACINGPDPGPDHRRCSSEDSQHNCNQRMAWRSKPHTHTRQGNRSPRDWSPQSNKKENSSNSRNYICQAWWETVCCQDMYACAVKKNGAGQITVEAKDRHQASPRRRSKRDAAILFSHGHATCVGKTGEGQKVGYSNPTSAVAPGL